MPGLTVSRIDPQAETVRYRTHRMETEGLNLDAEGQAMLEEDLRSPCTGEIAVFQAFSRAIRDATRQFVVMDTAPTGHTLLLLGATDAYHREVPRNLDPHTCHAVTPLMRLQDPAHTKVIITTLAETTPVLEASRLQADLSRAGITPSAWIVNNSLAAARPGFSLLRARAAREWPQIEAIRQGLAARLAVVPLLAVAPVGVERLRALSASAGWRSRQGTLTCLPGGR